MLWVVLVASLLGLLGANAIALEPSFYPMSQFFAQQLASLVWIKYTGVALLGGLILVYQWYRRSARLPLAFGKRLLTDSLLTLLVFAVTLTVGLTQGLTDYYRYQERRLTQPLTLDVLITPPQISDTVINPLAIEGQAQSSAPTNSRQVWQITQVLEEKSPQPTLADPQNADLPDDWLGRLPVNVWVTADTTEHQDWQTTLAQLKPGQSLTVKLALQPIRQKNYATLPPHAEPVGLGFDTALWLRQRDIQATAQLLEIHANTLTTYPATSIWQKAHLAIEQQRWQLRQHVLQHLKQSITHEDAAAIQRSSNSHAVLLGLLTGDKALMGSDIKRLYQLMGISHLLAISGPHVTLLASVVALILLAMVKTYRPQWFWYLPSRLGLLWVSVVVAGGYALLVGFDIPAQRTFWLLLFVTLATQWLVAPNPYRLLAWVALLMVGLDSTAVLQAGFWLSFVAVGLLLIYSGKQATEPMVQHGDLTPVGLTQSLWHGLKKLFWLQLWLFVWMLPVVIWFFGNVSLLGVLVNLIAVPVLGLIVVPLNLLAGVLSLLPGIGYWLSAPIWSLLAALLSLLHAGFNRLAQVGMAEQVFVSLGSAQLLLLMLTIGLLLSRGVLPRLLVLPLLLACIALPMARHSRSELSPQLTVLDNSQFGIVLLVTGKQAWLMLSDNRSINTAAQPHRSLKSAKPWVSKKNAAQATASQQSTSQQQQQLVTGLLEQDIYPLLASQHISRLTGVISQTPSEVSHVAIQQLAARVPIGQYWQAGFDALQPVMDDTGHPLSYPHIAAKPCQVGQQWTQAGLSVEAVTGWHLQLPPEQLSDADKQASQSCFIQIQHTSADKTERQLIASGRSEVPMQLAMQLCDIQPVNRLIAPAAMPLDAAWLSQIRPTQVHLLTSAYAATPITETNRFVLWQAQQQAANRHTLFSLSQSTPLGAIRYTLTPSNGR